jgi:hypothetical protein
VAITERELCRYVVGVESAGLDRVRYPFYLAVLGKQVRAG